jgi:Ni,Fe-hydrogenase III small subunit
VVAALASSAVVAQRAGAQATRLPRTRADVLLDMGEWSAAEEAYYEQSRAQPRAPVPRAALGRFLAMKGAVLPGTVLIEEANQFGLDSTLARTMLRPWQSVLSWRAIATLAADSTIVVRAPSDSNALFQLPIPRGTVARPTRLRTPAPAVTWADVVPRMLGADSLYTASPRVGIELIEAFVPSYDAESHKVTLHANRRSALRAQGRKYPVLRDTRDIRVLMTPGRAVSLPAALRELEPRWWQVDLLHGFIVVR